MNNVVQKNLPWLVLITACLFFLMMNLDFTAVNLALVAIARDVHTSLTAIQWITDIGVIAMAAFLILAGRLGDNYLMWV